MGKKMVIYLNPNERNAKAEDLGVSLELFTTEDQEKTIEGTFLLIDDQLLRSEEIENCCSSCAHPLLYNDEYDSEYCFSCDEWREDVCEDLDCDYCATRPEKPSHCK